MRSHPLRPSTIAIAACLLLAVAPWAPLVFTYTSEWLAVDRCLDSGGSFDYQAMRCDTTTNHPYIPFAQRHGGLLSVIPYLRTLSAIALLAAVAVLVGRSVMRPGR